MNIENNSDIYNRGEAAYKQHGKLLHVFPQQDWMRAGTETNTVMVSLKFALKFDQANK